MVATQICIGTVAMYNSGIGGGGFVLIRSADGMYEFVDFREMAPAAAYERMFSVENITLSLRGGLGMSPVLCLCFPHSGISTEGVEYLPTH